MDILTDIIRIFGDQGYKYIKQQFDIKNIPSTVTDRTIYVNLPDFSKFKDTDLSMNYNSDFQGLVSSINVNIIRKVAGIDYDEFKKHIKEILSDLIKSRNDSTVHGIVIDSITKTESGEYVIYTFVVKYIERL